MSRGREFWALITACDSRFCSNRCVGSRPKKTNYRKLHVNALRPYCLVRA